MKKTTLIRLPNFHLHNERQQPPLGLLYLAAYLRERDLPVDVVDLAGIPPEDWDSMVPDNSLVYGITATSPDYGMARKMLGFLRGRNGHQAKVIIGGVHSTVMPIQCVEDGFDAAVVGEGEQTLLEIVTGTPLSEVEGLAYRENGKIVVNPRRPMLPTIDHFPFPSRDFLPRENVVSTDLVTDSLPATVITTSRGCPFRCSFCVQQIWMNRWRHRTAQSIRAELELIKRDYPEVREIRFVDDMVGLNGKHSREICEAFKGMGLSWRCHLRVGVATESLLESFKEVGCVEISIGVESGDERILKHNHKGWSNIPQAAALFRTAKKLGLRTRAYFIIGLPGEAPESVERTCQTIKEIEADAVNIFSFVPYPGCDVWEHPEKYDYQLLDTNLDSFWMVGKGHRFVGRTSAMDVDQLEEAYQKAWNVARESGKANWMKGWE